MSSTEVMVSYLTGFSTLAMVLGVFGLLDAFNGETGAAAEWSG